MNILGVRQLASSTFRFRSALFASFALAIALLALSQTTSAAGGVQWLHVEGNKVVNESGHNVLLRGVNIENREWMWSC